MMSKINKRKIVDIENRTVENVHQIAELLNLPVAIKYNSNIVFCVKYYNS